MQAINTLHLAMASDHAGFALKQTVRQYLEQQGATVEDCGCFSTDSCDYPDFAHPLADKVAKGEVDYGIAICSTGNGITMTCNHHQGVRAALCWDIPLADLARRHNNANIVGLPAHYISTEKALEIIHTFFTTDFEGGRHERRISKIDC